MCNGQKPLSHTNHWDYDKTKKRIKAGKEFPEALDRIIKNNNKPATPFLDNVSGIKEVLLRMENKINLLADDVKELKDKQK